MHAFQVLIFNNQYAGRIQIRGHTCTHISKNLFQKVEAVYLHSSEYPAIKKSISCCRGERYVFEAAKEVKARMWSQEGD